VHGRCEETEAKERDAALEQSVRRARGDHGDRVEAQAGTGCEHHEGEEQSENHVVELTRTQRDELEVAHRGLGLDDRSRDLAVATGVEVNESGTTIVGVEQVCCLRLRSITRL